MPIVDLFGVPHVYDLTPPVPHTRGLVLVFVHGWLLSRSYWQPLVELLSPSFQCLTYDLRGFGESSCWSALGESGDGDRPNCYQASAYAQDLVQLLQKLQVQQGWLIGHSLGGTIALWAADARPDLIKGVICLNSGGGIYLKEEFERFRRAGQQIVKHRPRWLYYFPCLDLLFSRAMVARPLDRLWGKQRLRDFVQAETIAALGSLLATTTEEEVHLLPQVVARLQQPVYFVAGARDRVMEPKYVRHLASFHPLFETLAGNAIEIPNCGHLPMVECPQAVYTTVFNCLQQHLEREIVSQ